VFLPLFTRLSTIRRNMPIDQHRRKDIVELQTGNSQSDVEKYQAGNRCFTIGGANDGRTWPFGQVRTVT
jgi:hypothetical protein